MLKFLLPPEISHSLAITILKFLPYQKPKELPESLGVSFFNHKLKTPVGLAAGFDKNAEIIKYMFSLGFGFVEAGTVTKNPQHGNKKPRVFRLIQDKGVINRLGFNNKGIDYFIAQLNKSNLQNHVFGINIGKSFSSDNQINDYVDLIKKIYGKSSYITLNISSPNTPNLCNLHKRKELMELLKAVTQTRKSIDNNESIPIILKISPDIDEHTKESIAELVIEYKINGLIVSNTTVNCRDKLHSHQDEKGGLSGKPLFQLSTKVLSDMYKLTKGKILLIGCGGISSGKDAYEKIKSGASLVQLYTALIYEGFHIVNKINLDLVKLIEKDGFKNIGEAIGCLYK
ncbi:quinone-dependent dihydroorotate dehydrogenase [Wolbachia endosymbiont of Pentidionis agamae]|uniref:quinone-dependent dihydroorotate dehydrogenase n=1 Tax=Wolbachia endosymbiont of Pentidionis agamae TaxID=3110435 RepID=UPI002FD734F8